MIRCICNFFAILGGYSDINLIWDLSHLDLGSECLELGIPSSKCCALEEWCFVIDIFVVRDDIFDTHFSIIRSMET